MNRDEKASMVSDLNESFSRAKFAVVTDYRGLKVTELEKLRRNLRQCDARFRIAKNTLLRRAVKGTDCEALTESLTGTTAVAIGFDDPVASAKALFEFAKEYKELNIRSAVLDGSVLSADDVAALSMLPGKDVLRAKLLGTMAAVPTGLVRVLSAVPQNFVYALQAIKEQKEN
ncbi:MAG: 50S ribosomal protein L10 [Deltaproteobacteria bacterium]|nr:50S ribosomal protein L10 [Deltaproteobacteria bacterium]